MTEFSDKVVAFIDVLGFRGLVERAAEQDDAGKVSRIIKELYHDNDLKKFEEYGPELCPRSPHQNNDLLMRMTQTSDSLVISAEMTPLGVLNVVNCCRIIAERLLLREKQLCRGYIASGRLVHQEGLLFGPGYHAALDGEKMAGSLEMSGQSGGSPLVEIDETLMQLVDTGGDACIKEMMCEMVDVRKGVPLVHPYGVFRRMVSWAIDPSKSIEQMRKEIGNARTILESIEETLRNSTPLDERAQMKLEASLERARQVWDQLADADKIIDCLASPASR